MQSGTVHEIEKLGGRVHAVTVVTRWSVRCRWLAHLSLRRATWNTCGARSGRAPAPRHGLQQRVWPLASRIRINDYCILGLA